VQRMILVSELRERSPESLVLLDVRRRIDLEQDPQRIVGAQWRDPEHVAAWAPDLPTDSQIVVYCVRGRSVSNSNSNSVLDHLLERGLKARLLEGGIEAWKQAGGMLEEQKA
jgi:rhodanese-related sulfurtransferase